MYTLRISLYMDKGGVIVSKKNESGSATNKVGAFLSKTKNSIVNVVDKDGDGKFSAKDISIAAGAVGESVKSGVVAIKDFTEEKSKINEYKTLQPIFPQTLNEGDFFLPKFIRVKERSKKYAESEVCQNSIGHYSNQKDLKIVNIFKDSVDYFGISFYPDDSAEFYYVDPSDRDRYIALDEYFGYLKVERINELQKIAHSLGAKYFKVTFKEEQTHFTEKKIKAGVNATRIVSANANHSSTEKKFNNIEIAAEMECEGHSPTKPQLRYLQRDPNIQTLITLRMDEEAPISHQKYMLKMSNSSGIKVNDAVNIDAFLKSLKYAGNTSVESEARNESRRYLEYEIYF